MGRAIILVRSSTFAPCVIATLPDRHSVVKIETGVAFRGEQAEIELTVEGPDLPLDGEQIVKTGVWRGGDDPEFFWSHNIDIRWRLSPERLRVAKSMAKFYAAVIADAAG